MKPTDEINPGVDDQSSAGESRTLRIRRHVLRSLGSPAGLLDVKIHPLGSDCYRVNVVTGKGPTDSRIVNSFYLTADRDGAITKSSPEIVRLY